MHRGQIIENDRIELGIKKSIMASKLGISRPTLDSWLQMPDLSMNQVLAMGEAMGKDYMTQLTDFKFKNTSINYNPIESEVNDDGKLNYRDKYISALETLNTKLLEYNESLENRIKNIEEKLSGKEHISTELDAMSQHLIELFQRSNETMANGFQKLAEVLDK